MGSRSNTVNPPRSSLSSSCKWLCSGWLLPVCLAWLLVNPHLVEGLTVLPAGLPGHEDIHLREQGRHVVAGRIARDSAARGFDQVAQNAQPAVQVCQRRACISPCSTPYSNTVCAPATRARAATGTAGMKHVHAPGRPQSRGS